MSVLEKTLSNKPLRRRPFTIYSAYKIMLLMAVVFWALTFLFEGLTNRGYIHDLVKWKRLREGNAFVQKEGVLPPSFFRFEAQYEYKGNPVTVNVVVRCETFVTEYINGVKRERSQRFPGLYAARMDDNTALMVQMPDACKGETTANRQVPENYLPVTVVYDNADTMAFGVGYFSDDAYENSQSVLKFKQAKVYASNRAEKEEWERTSSQNLIKDSLWTQPLEAEDFKAVQEKLKNVDALSDEELAALPGYPWRQNKEAFGYCYGVIKLPVPEKAKEFIAKIRPEGAKFWQPHLYDQTILYDLMFSSPDMPGALYDGRPLTDYIYNDLEKGIARRDGTGRFGDKATVHTPSFFPQWSDDGYSLFRQNHLRVRP